MGNRFSNVSNERSRLGAMAFAYVDGDSLSAGSSCYEVEFREFMCDVIGITQIKLFVFLLLDGASLIS